MKIFNIAGKVKKVLYKIYAIANGFPNGFNYDKKKLIDYAFNHCVPTPNSIVDLGGVWGVDGAYTFYIADLYKPQKMILVDTNFTDVVIKKSGYRKEIQLIHGNFGDQELINSIGSLDTIIMFDVLLHQVNPNWDEVLGAYAKNARIFIIFNQQWTGSENTVRLIDLGQEGYYANIPHNQKHLPYRNLFSRLDEIHPDHGRPWRDVHNIWQWGITDKDLISKMNKLGFKIIFFKNHGSFENLKNFENHAFIFEKQSS